MVFFYGLSFFFTDFGPNTTTFVIPSLIFPTEGRSGSIDIVPEAILDYIQRLRAHVLFLARATCHGLSAAAGKLGALLGGAVFLRIQESGCTNGQCHAVRCSLSWHLLCVMLHPCCIYGSEVTLQGT
jgi:PHS family inorganic phosphate transporter-like MFS transporter